MPTTSRSLARAPNVLLSLLLSVGVFLSAAFTTAGRVNAFGPIIYLGVAKVTGAIVGGAKLTDYRARRAYEKAVRSGTCEERRQQMLAILPEAIKLGSFARDIYVHPAEVPADQPVTKDLGEGRTAVYDPTGQRYAEIRDDPIRGEVVVVFRGTRLGVITDLSTDVLYYAGIEAAYYTWATALVAKVVREHPGRQVVVTGHSLGGGLAIDAVLHNPGVRGVAFNPAGLSWIRWLRTSHSDRARTSAAITVIAQRNASHIDALTALSMSKQTVLPGRPLFVETQATGVRNVHSMTTLVASLERIAHEGASGNACDGLLDAMH
jgi:lipase (class 3)